MNENLTSKLNKMSLKLDISSKLEAKKHKEEIEKYYEQEIEQKKDEFVKQIEKIKKDLINIREENKRINKQNELYEKNIYELEQANNFDKEELDNTKNKLKEIQNELDKVKNELNNEKYVKDRKSTTFTCTWNKRKWKIYKSYVIFKGSIFWKIPILSIVAWAPFYIGAFIKRKLFPQTIEKLNQVKDLPREMIEK